MRCPADHLDKPFHVVKRSRGGDLCTARVGVIMGSDSDMGRMLKATEVLSALDIEWEMRVISLIGRLMTRQNMPRVPRNEDSLC